MLIEIRGKPVKFFANVAVRGSLRRRTAAQRSRHVRRQRAGRLHAEPTPDDRQGAIVLASLGVDEGQVVIRRGVVGAKPQHLFVRGQRLVQLPHLLQHDAQIVTGVGMLRLDLQRRPVPDQGLARTLPVPQNISQVIVRIGQGRFEFRGFLVRLGSLLPLLPPLEHGSQIDVAVRCRRPAPDGFAVGGFGVIELSQRHEQPAQGAVDLGIVRLQPDRPLEGIGRFGVAPPVVQHVAQVGQRVGVVRSAAQGLPVVFYGLAAQAQLAEHRPQIVVRFGIIGSDAQCGGELGTRLVQSPQPLQQAAQIVVRFGVSWSQSQCLTVGGHGFHRPLGGLQCAAQTPPVGRLVRQESNRRPNEADRLLVAAPLMSEHTQ